MNTAWIWTKRYSKRLQDSYEIQAEFSESEILFELVVFDSQDIDDSRKSNLAWQEENHAN